MTNDEAVRRADESLRDFVASMRTAGNPGSGRHELGLHKVEGWILDFDPTIGGSELQAVIGVDGSIHARRAPRSQRTRKLTASEWALRDQQDADAAAGAAAFADRLARLLAFNNVVGDASGT